jgi:AcrR family transcriptional regulator
MPSQGTSSLHPTPAAPIRGPRSRAGAETRDQILNQAADLASVEGLDGLSLGRLATELGMSKSGLYAHFGSKEELQLATLEQAAAMFIAEIEPPMTEAGAGVLRLRAMLEAWTAYVESEVFSGGCFFAAASAEFDDRPGAVRERIVALTGSWVRAIEKETQAAINAGELAAKLDPGQLAFEVHAFLQEANWAWQLHDEPLAFKRARTAMRSALTRSATPKGLALL